MSLKRIISILFLCCCTYMRPLCVCAQPLNFTVYSEADGLPSGYIQAALEDSRGFLWLCTIGGLSRFDGRNFKNYDIKDGMPDNFCDNITEDKKGNLWIATRGGLCYFDGKKFTSYTYPAGLSTTYFNVLQVDKSNRLICALNRQNVTAADGIVEYIDLVKDVPGLPSQKYVVTILPDGSKILNTIKGVYKVSKQNQPSLIFSSNNFATYFYFHPDEENAFYFFNEKGVYHWQDGNLESLSTINFDNEIVTALFVDAQKRIWLSAEDKGVWIIDKNKTDFIDKAELPGYLVPSIYQDKRGVMWICTFRGLVKVTKQFAAHFTKATGLDNEDIRFSGKLYDGSICMQTTLIKNGSPVLLPGNLSKQLTYNRFSTYVRGIEIDDKQRWWIFALDNNVYWWQKEVLTKAPLPPGSGIPIRGFFDVKEQTIWYAKESEIILVKDDSVVKIINTLADGSSLNPIHSMAKDYYGNVWVSERKRLLLYTKKGLVDYTPNLKLQQKVLVEMACSDEKGIWFKTKGFGAIHFTFANNIFLKDKTITTDNGLTNNIVHDIETDSRQNIWIATLSGLYRFTENKQAPNTYNTRSFTKADGINVPNWNLAFLEKDSLDNIWLGVANGIFKININSIHETSSKPAVIIDEVTVLNNTDSQRIDSSGFSANNAGAVFNAAQNDIAFHFTGINLNNNFIRYAYMLQGIDKNWITNQKNNEAIYYNLPPAKYSFLVKAINDAGLESKTEAYSFTILPPFWQRVWFRLLIAVLAIALIYWFIRRRDAIKEKENLTALQTSELKLAALQSQMNPHFIFNSLNSIQNYILQQKPVEAARYLSKFSKLMRRILDQSFNSLTPLHEIVETLKMYMELEAFRFSNEFSWEVKITDAESIGDVKLPPLLLQPYVENAIVHGLMPKQGDKKLIIHLYKSNNQLHCIIDDNGIGRSNELNTKDGHISRGQKLTSDMLATMKQLLHTDAQISITDKTDAQNKPTGTTIDLIIPLTFDKGY